MLSAFLDEAHDIEAASVRSVARAGAAIVTLQLRAATLRFHVALAAGEWVLCDRFADSTAAYQGYGRGLDLAVIEVLNQMARGTIRPGPTRPNTPMSATSNPVRG